MPDHLAAPELWLVGSGGMAVSYAQVLEDLRVPFLVIGRGGSSAEAFKQKTGRGVVKGGLADHLAGRPSIPGAAIVAVGVEQLAPTTMLLLDAGLKRILIEKPGGLDAAEIRKVTEKAEAVGARVYLGYNRRFYASVLKAQDLILEDGGVGSFAFEFTEWGHVIEGLDKAPGVKENWFLANSTHVVDLAFHLGGLPVQFQSYATGQLPWHPLASAFAGAGVTEHGALFSYQANWAAPGRWGVEILTRRHRLFLRPMEQLQIQGIGSIDVRSCEIEDDLDRRFKPGLHRQVTAFLSAEPPPALLGLADHLKRVEQVYLRMLVPGQGRER